MHVAVLDGSNLLHRARHGVMGMGGENAFVYSFFRCLRPLIGDLKPDAAYMVLEGRPAQQLDLLPEYKDNRRITDPVKAAEHMDFVRQRETIMSLMGHFPIHVARHPEFEGDDVMGAIVTELHPNDAVTVISSDTDFIQLVQRHPACTLYNPITKRCRPAPDYDYVSWKSLRGDPGDGIPGIKGIGDKRAEILVRDSARLAAFLSSEPEAGEIYRRNVSLIGLTPMSDRLSEIEITFGDSDWHTCRRRLDDLGFESITNAISWMKFISSFRALKRLV